MRARVERDALRRALHTVLPAVSTKASPGSTTTGVLIEVVDGNGLRFTGTDLYTTITADVDAKITGDGRMVAPARLLAGYIDRCPDGGVELALSKGRLSITAGESTFDLNLLAAEMWPNAAPLTGEPYSTLTADHIDLIRRIAPFRDTTNRQAEHLSGIHLEGNTAGATDSYGMGFVILADVDLVSVTIPAEAFLLAIKDATEVEIRANETRVTISHDACTWSTVLLEGKFPDLTLFAERTKPDHALTVGARDIVDSLGRTALLDQQGKPVRLRRDGGKLYVSIVEPELGTIEDVISCEGDYPEGSDIGFRADLLSLVIAAVGEDQVTLEMTDPYKPVLARSEHVVALVMPIRPAVTAA